MPPMRFTFSIAFVLVPIVGVAAAFAQPLPGEEAGPKTAGGEARSSADGAPALKKPAVDTPKAVEPKAAKGAPKTGDSAPGPTPSKRPKAANGAPSAPVLFPRLPTPAVAPPAWVDPTTQFLLERRAPWVFSTPQVADGQEASWAFEVHPEYRVRYIDIHPLELNGTLARDVSYAEQRLRLDVAFSRTGLGSVFVQVDMLDGVLFGDNGTFGLLPEVNSGLGVASKQPNLAGWQVGLLEGRDPLALDSYGPMLRPIEPIRINYAYGEVILPFGVLRAGRMPTADAGNLAIHDGRTGRNLWGASYYHNASDRILFGTKISEAFLLLADPDHKVDRDREDGVFLGLVYDFLVNDDIYRTSDDLQQFAVQLDWKLKHFRVAGVDGRLRLTGTLTHRWSASDDTCVGGDCPYNTSIFAVPLKFELELGDFFFEAQATFIEGQTRELSAGFSELNNRPVVDQRLSSTAARLWFEGKLGPVTLLGVWAYASGDRDPRPETPMTTGSWSRDSNLGLLLFEHIIAFQSARSAAVGIENLVQLKAKSFPLTEIQTDGRVSNANVINPQVFIDAFEHLGEDFDHSLTIKLGALFAWTAVSGVDPIQSILAWDGENIDDDLLNYHGGRPGNYWGTELDIGLEYAYRDLFGLILEAAVVFPGDALHDENGDAVMSWMLESRLVFRL